MITTPSPLALGFGPASPPTDLRVSLLEIGTAVFAVLRFSARRAGGPPRLTSAETSVMTAIFEGKSNEAIARERGTSARTVANQIASIFRKHGVASRCELVASYLAPPAAPPPPAAPAGRDEAAGASSGTRRRSA